MARAAVLSFKDRGRRELVRVLGRCLALTAGAAALAEVGRRDGAGACCGGSSGLPDHDAAGSGAAGPFGRSVRSAGSSAVGLVPIPSTRAAARARGGDHMRRLAIAAAAQLTASGLVATVVPLLAPTGRVRDSVQLTAAQRAANARDAFVATDRPPGGVDPLIVVDDVITTGATLTAAVTALRRAGTTVHAAAVVAATARRKGAPFVPDRTVFRHLCLARLGDPVS